MALDVVFLTPRDSLVGLAGVIPLAALVVGRARAARVRRRLHLPGGRAGFELLAGAAIVAIAALLGLAAAQPVLEHATERRVRTDAAALFVIDTSRSMQSSASPSAPTRLQRARVAALATRDLLSSIPAGVASITDRVLPLLLPSPDERVFDSVVTRALAADSPPPRDRNVVATTFNALRNIGPGNFFAGTARHRVVILLTDGESRQFDSAGVAAALRREPRIGLVVWRIGSEGDRFWSADGTADPDFRPARSAPAALRALSEGGARPVADARAAATAARSLLGSGPEVGAGTLTGRTPLSPYAVAAALVPLAGLLALRLRRC